MARLRTSTTIDPPLPAATVVILRDGSDGPEVFMVVRHQEIDFASGALVFPGGKVDPGDADAAWAELAPYAAAAPDRAFVVAAVRETFEEAGLVLARRRGTQAMLDADDTHRLVETYRAPLLAGETTFLDLVHAEDLLLATDLMVPFAHWITPERVGEARATRDALTKDAGRDPRTLSISVHGQSADRDLVKRLLEAGATRVVIRPATMQSDADMAKELTRIADALLR